ncbi:MAG: thioredoxin family protein [candidate division KSB1 bacterium]|nr:thioredoxin family protein [candidate division KSB1 bacterium]
MVIKILGIGCPNCIKLEELAKKATQELNVNAEFVKVREIDKILDYGIARTPGLVINEVVKSAGRIPTIDQIKAFIQESL